MGNLFILVARNLIAGTHSQAQLTNCRGLEQRANNVNFRFCKEKLYPGISALERLKTDSRYIKYEED